jgi:hypothetical protein
LRENSVAARDLRLCACGRHEDRKRGVAARNEALAISVDQCIVAPAGEGDMLLQRDFQSVGPYAPHPGLADPGQLLDARAHRCDVGGEEIPADAPANRSFDLLRFGPVAFTCNDDLAQRQQRRADQQLERADR